jgi:segregation and condensation protein B
MFGRKGIKRVEVIESEQPQSSEESAGFSLEDLKTAYSEALQHSAQGGTTVESTVESDGSADDLDQSLPEHEALLDAPAPNEADDIPLRLDSTLEAMLFLGTSNNQPLSLVKLAELFRDLTPDEIDECVDSLNQMYKEDDRAFEIVREPGGYRMKLAADLNMVRDRFYSKQKETQLTQAAIDCLSLIAYQPGVTREKIEEQWNQPAGTMLATLVRKGLVLIEKSESPDGLISRYFTTDRFLEVIGLSSLEDLPLTEDI